MSHTWVYHPAIEQYWLCPDEALQDQIALGWRPCEAPPEPNPAVAERIAFERELRERQAEKDAAEEPDGVAEDREEKPTTKTRPRRGTSENEEG